MPGEFRGQISVGSGGGHGRRSFEVVDQGSPPSPESMRALRRKHAAAVTVVTFTTDAGYRGVTVSAFCIVSLAPPIVLICLGQGSEAATTIEQTRSYAVSVLSDRQEFLAERFAGRAPLVNPRFEGVPHRLTRSGNPVLEECLVWFDCQVGTVVPSGDHLVFFGQVREAGYGTGVAPLLYFDGAYHELLLD